MSVAGYFGREVRQLRMIRRGMPRDADEAGIEYDGKVLCGEASVEQARAMDGADSVKHPLADYLTAYWEVEEYDRVLLWHCRL